jgi:hypothetical protein
VCKRDDFWPLAGPLFARAEAIGVDITQVAEIEQPRSRGLTSSENHRSNTVCRYTLPSSGDRVEPWTVPSDGSVNSSPSSTPKRNSYLSRCKVRYRPAGLRCDRAGFAPAG